jgi:hypothetical protein
MFIDKFDYSLHIGTYNLVFSSFNKLMIFEHLKYKVNEIIKCDATVC